VSTELSNVEKAQKLKWALLGDVCNVVYCYLSFAGPVFLLYLDNLRLDKSRIGVILALFPLASLLGLFTAPVAARLGLKRVFLVFWTVRQFVFLLMIATPWIIHAYGANAGFLFAVGVVSMFAVCRAVGESAFTPWSSEFIPTSIRGKFSALLTMAAMISAAVTIATAGQLLGEKPTTRMFQTLIGCSIFFGLMQVVLYSRVPGGGAVPPPLRDHPTAGLLTPLKDRVFRRFLLGGAMANLAWMPMIVFLPLFYKEQVGLSPEVVVRLDAVVMIAGLCSSLLWGWAADRYGGKPVMLLNLTLMMLYPIGLMLLPRQHPFSAVSAVALVALVGLVTPGWNIGYNRCFFVDLVPPHARTSYAAIHAALVGLIAGLSPLAAGRLLDALADWPRRVVLGVAHVDAYTPIFIHSLVVGLMAVVVLGRLNIRAKVPLTYFASMFITGDPIGAVRAIIGYQFAGYETRRVSLIEKLGQTRSPFNVEELVAALDDPSFNVRYEAVISIARTRRDPRLTAAMVELLDEADQDLRPTVAWALGRMGDHGAAPALRGLLDSPYQLLTAQAARALAMLGDSGSSDRILDLFRAEPDPALRTAYASALGGLGRDDVIDELLAFLHDTPSDASRREVSLAIATLLGKDEQALRLWRRAHDHPGDTLGGVMLGLQRRWRQSPNHRELQSLAGRCARAFGHENLPEAIELLCELVRQLDFARLKPGSAAVVRESAARLQQYGPQRREYAALLVHALHVGPQEHGPRAAPRREQPSAY